MHSENMLDSLTELAQELGYQIRYEWLDGSGGGACQYRGEHWLFLDLAADPAERAHTVAAALAGDDRWKAKALAPELREMLGGSAATESHKHS